MHKSPFGQADDRAYSPADLRFRVRPYHGRSGFDSPIIRIELNKIKDYLSPLTVEIAGQNMHDDTFKSAIYRGHTV